MPELDYLAENLENVPEEFKGLYNEEEKDGKKFYRLTVNGVKPQDEFDKVYKALSSERELKSNFEKNLKAFGEWTPEKIKTMQDELDSLKKAKNSASEEEFLKRLNEVKTNASVEMQKLKDEYAKTEVDYKKQIEEKENLITEMRLESALTALYDEKGEPSGRDLAIQLAKKQLHWNPEAKDFRTLDGFGDMKSWLNDELFKKHECLLKGSVSAKARETGGNNSEYEKYFNPKMWNGVEFDDPKGEPFAKRLEFFRKNPEKAKELLAKYKQ